MVGFDNHDVVISNCTFEGRMQLSSWNLTVDTNRSLAQIKFENCTITGLGEPFQHHTYVADKMEKN